MRNLKRALSLAMASVMLLGMMVVGTGASYADVDSKDNVEAIEVMQAVGVMSGDDKGNFNPDQKVTRVEMAVVMANMLDLKVEDFVGAKIPFTDVPEWAVPYVAACYADGITAGISATQYGSNYEVTTAQAALMMMKALGYFQYTSDFGSDWQVATVKQGSKIALFDGIEAGASEAMTRNDVAQIALNTLEANVVEAEGSDGISIGDVTIGSSIKYVDLLVDTAGGKNDYAKAFGDTASEGTKYAVQLGEQLFDGKLEKTAGTETDEFLRPGQEWLYNDDRVAFGVEDPVAVFTAKASASDIAKELKSYSLSGGQKINDNSDNKGDGSTYIQTSKNGASAGDSSVQLSSSKTIAASVAELTANGKVVEFYDVDDNDVIDTIVEIVYTVDTVDDITTNKTETTYTIGSESGKIYAEDQDKEDTIVLASEIAEDDVVTYVKSAKNSKLYVYPTTTFVGAQSAKTSETITVSGTKYDVALGVETVTMAGFANSSDNYNFYVDQYGFVVKSDAVEESTNYAVIDKIAVVGATGTATNKSIEAVLVFGDGSVKTVNVTKFNGDKAKDVDSSGADYTAEDNYKISTNVETNKAVYQGMIVTYTEKDGDYEVDVAAQPKDVKPVTPSGSGDTALNVTEKGVPTFYYQDQTGTAANNETVYVIKTDDDEFASYTGFKNVPTVKLHGEDDDDSVETAAVSYVSTADNGVEFVFVDASGASSVGDTTTGDIFYVTDNDYTTVGSGSDTYYELTGILNGKVGTIKSESETMVKTTLAEGKLYELKVDNDGYVTDATEQASGTAYVKAEVDTNEAKGGVLDTDGTDYTYDGSETVIVIDDDEVVGGSISSAKDGDTVYVKVVDKSGTAAEQIAIEVIYIIKAA